jgi:hypothetical protein
VPTFNLEHGKLYLLTYKQQAGNYQWYKHQMVAVYLDEDNNEFEPRYIFSLRPKAGTQDMRKDALLAAKEMPRSYGTRLPVKIGKYEGSS